MRFKDKRQHMKRELTLQNVTSEKTPNKYDVSLSVIKLKDPDSGLFVEAETTEVRFEVDQKRLLKKLNQLRRANG